MSELEGKTLDELRKLARERGLIKGMAVYQYSKAEIAEGLIDGTMPNKQTTQRDGINLTDEEIKYIENEFDSEYEAEMFRLEICSLF